MPKPSAPRPPEPNPKEVFAMNDSVTQRSDTSGSALAALLLSWLAVGVPLAWGVFATLQKALALFG